MSQTALMPVMELGSDQNSNSSSGRGWAVRLLFLGSRGMCTKAWGDEGKHAWVGGQVEDSIVHCTKAFPKIFVLGSIFSSVQGRDAFFWLVLQTKIRKGMRKEKRALQVLWWGSDDPQGGPMKTKFVPCSKAVSFFFWYWGFNSGKHNH